MPLQSFPSLIIHLPAHCAHVFLYINNCSLSFTPHSSPPTPSPTPHPYQCNLGSSCIVLQQAPDPLSCTVLVPTIKNKLNIHNFAKPSWMPTPFPPDPTTRMDMGPILADELDRAIRRAKPSSAPSPFDWISYLIFKKCPALQVAILNLMNSVLSDGVIPSSWKAAAVKLIPKSAAAGDPSSPGNFRPIALTPSISKLFSGILKDRWLLHMKANKYLDSDIQKAFLPTTPGVTEHQVKLGAIIKAAKRSKQSLAIAWLDIANAYGSVHHNLIQFAMAHYYAPPEFCQLL